MNATEWTAAATIILAVLAFAQFCAMARQAKHMRDGLDETRKGSATADRNAKAAEENAAAAQSSAAAALTQVALLREQQRPWVLVGNPELLIPSGSPWNGSVDERELFLVLKWSIYNPSPSPAFLTEIGADLVCVELSNGKWPELISYPGVSVDKMVLVAGSPHVNKRPAKQITRKMLVDLLHENAALCFVGGVRYFDQFGGMHTSRFFFTWTFQPSPEPNKYNLLYSVGGPPGLTFYD